MDKIISLLIASSYIVAEYIATRDGKIMFATILFLIFPLYLIWYGEGLGKWKFFEHITTETPDFMTKFTGWLLLLMPLIAVMISEMSRRDR